MPTLTRAWIAGVVGFGCLAAAAVITLFPRDGWPEWSGWLVLPLLLVCFLLLRPLFTTPERDGKVANHPVPRPASGLLTCGFVLIVFGVLYFPLIPVGAGLVAVGALWIWLFDRRDDA